MSYGNTDRESREGRTEHGNKTIIINIVKRDEEVKERLYIRYTYTRETEININSEREAERYWKW
jgi:hypothetical protein